MHEFDLKRFLNVVRWIFTVNNKFYTRAAMLIFGCVLLPVVYRYLSVMLGDTGMYYKYDTGDLLVDVTQFLSCFFGPVFMVMLCYTFHSLVDRQGRINEFTLPASNMEKFLAHVTVTVLGAIATFLVSLLAADLVNLVLGTLLFGHGSFSSLTVAALEGSFSWTVLLSGLPKDVDGIMLLAAMYLSSLGCVSLFVLMSVWKYRHTLAYGILYLVVFFLVFSLLLGFIVRYLPAVLVLTIGQHNINKLVMCCMDKRVGALLSLLLATGLLCLIWHTAYRLYCRGQVTTKRNP